MEEKGKRENINKQAVNLYLNYLDSLKVFGEEQRKISLISFNQRYIKRKAKKCF